LSSIWQRISAVYRRTEIIRLKSTLMGMRIAGLHVYVFVGLLENLVELQMKSRVFLEICLVVAFTLC